MKRKCRGNVDLKEMARSRFEEVQGALLRSKQPNITQEEMSMQLEENWRNWLVEQGFDSDDGQVTFCGEPDEISKGDYEVKMEDIGFGRTRGRTFFPALKFALPGCDDRIKVSS